MLTKDIRKPSDKPREHLRSRPLRARGWAAFAVLALASSCSSDEGGDDSGFGTGSGSGNRPGAPSGDLIGEEIVGGGSGSGTSPGSGSGGAIDEESACAVSRTGVVSEPAVVQLLVDTSLSMQESPGGRRGRNQDSKWVITQRALQEAINELGSDVSLGLTFYPNTDSIDSRCIDERPAVNIATLGGAGSAHRQALADAIGRADVGGGTPTHDAYENGLESLRSSSADGRQFLVLITDGVPTFERECRNFTQSGVDTEPLIAATEAAFAEGIRTFVIGSPGSEGARESLSRMASVGGTGSQGCSHSGGNYCHFDMTEDSDLGAGLAEALGTISEALNSCEYRIPPGNGMVDKNKVNVLFTGSDGETQTISRDPSDDQCDEGWQYSADGQSIVLCGETCERAKNEVGSSVEVLFGCVTQVADVPGPR